MTSYVPGPGSSYRWNKFQGISSFQQPDLRHVAIPGQVIQVNNSGSGNLKHMTPVNSRHWHLSCLSWPPEIPKHLSSPPLGPTMGRWGDSDLKLPPDASPEACWNAETNDLSLPDLCDIFFNLYHISYLVVKYTYVLVLCVQKKYTYIYIHHMNHII